jgi:secreted PhoX family phosphatase
MKRRTTLLATVVAIVTLSAGMALSAMDFGSTRDALLASKTRSLFGINAPLAASSTTSANLAAAQADATKLVTLAKGLRASVVTQGAAAPVVDMIALWPDDTDPTHLIFCDEEDPGDPGLQRLDLATGAVATIVTGTQSCDPAHVTPWGSVIFAEEAGGGTSGGRFYELIDPLHTTNVLLDRATGAITDGPGGEGASNLVARTALGILSYEGIGILPSGVVYYADEQRPNTGTTGGAYFKFVPSALRDPDAGPISSLSGSPLVSGSVYGLRLGKRSGSTDYGQGTEFGLGTWVPITGEGPVDLRAATATLKLTGYYRPEDLAFDRAELDAGNVRFCSNNTGNEGDDRLWGNTICVTDGTLGDAGANTAVPEVQLLVQGNPQFAMMDNIAYQPGRGNWVIHEDGASSSTGRNNDLWDCLPDGTDDDTLSDGCVRIGTINDLGPAGGANEGDPAEWTGGVFDATGAHFFVSIQHNMTGSGVILDITGWR